MKINKLKIFIIISTIFIISIFASLTATAEQYGDYLYYLVNSDNTEISITGCNISATEVDIPNEINGLPVTTIEYHAFDNCKSLTSVTIPKNIDYVENAAFYNCSNLKTVYFNAQKADMGYSYYSDGLRQWVHTPAFSGCSAFTDIYIGNEVEMIDSYAFYNCRNLTSVYISDIVSYLNIDFKDAYSNPMYYANKMYLNNKRITTLTIPDGATKIPDYAFYKCDSLNTVNIPNSVESIGKNAFFSCTGLTNAIIGNGAIRINEYAFYNCSNLTNITIGNSVESIGKNAFENCNMLEKIYISNIGQWCNVTLDNEYSNPMYYAGELYLNDGLIANLIIPDDVTNIASGVFRNCKSLKSITIPQNITGIGSNCFYGCDNLTSLNYNAQTVFSNVFNGKKFKSVILGDSVTSVDTGAFSNCTDLTKVFIPKSVTEIEKNAFSGCSAITTVEYGGDYADWMEIFIGENNESLKNAQINYNSLYYGPYDTPVVTKSSTDALWKFEVTVEQTYDNSYVYAVIYNMDNNIVGMKRVPIELDGMTSIEVDKSGNAKTAKIFVWTNNMQPITKVAKIEL